MKPGVYTPTFERAKYKYRQNGYFARYLDADDYAFLEHVRQRGIANGDLPTDTNAFLLEELGFWHYPYAVDHTVQRRQGEGKLSRYKLAIIPDADEAARQAKRNRDRQLLKAEKAAVQKAWDDERKKLIREREERIKRERETDLEWNEAVDNSMGSRWDLPLRHYVPHWKRDEWARKDREAAQRASRKKREQIAQRAYKALIARRAKQAQEEEKAAALMAEQAQAALYNRAIAEARRIETAQAQQRAQEEELAAIARREQEIMEDVRRELANARLELGLDVPDDDKGVPF